MEPSNEILTVNKIFDLANDINQENNDSIKGCLIILINELINNNFSSLVQLLYRIDIDENKLKETLKQQEGFDSASVIAEMIIKRQLQKIAAMKAASPGIDPPSEDRW